jgi:hypothetical protein
MTRFAGLVLLTSTLAVAGLHAAALPPRNKPDGGPRAKQPLPGLDDKKAKKADEETEQQKKDRQLIARIAKNMEGSEKRLSKQDARRGTQQIQRDILKDLDELIDKARKQGENEGDGKAQKDPDGKRGPQRKGAPKDGGTEGKRKGPGGESGKDGGRDGTRARVKTDNQRQNPPADMGDGRWGEMPTQRRLQMDQYAKDRFMAKYSRMLEQYYRAISEQQRRGSDE